MIHLLATVYLKQNQPDLAAALIQDARDRGVDCGATESILASFEIKSGTND